MQPLYCKIDSDYLNSLWPLVGGEEDIPDTEIEGEDD